MMGVRFWNVTTGQEASGLGGPNIGSVIFAPNGKTIAVTFGIWSDLSLALWEVGSAQPLRILKEHVGFLPTVFFVRDGKAVACVAPVSSSTGAYAVHTTATLWDVA